MTLHNPPRRKKLSFGPLSLNDRFTIAAHCLLFQNNGIHSKLINPALCTRGCPCVACRSKTRPQLLLSPVSSGVLSFYPSPPCKCPRACLCPNADGFFDLVLLLAVFDSLTQLERSIYPWSLAHLSYPCLSVGLVSTTLDATLGKELGLFNWCLPFPQWRRSTRPSRSQEPSTLLLTYNFIQTILALGQS